MSNETIKLNGVNLTKELFEEKKKEYESKKIKIVEVAPKVYKTKLED